MQLIKTTELSALQKESVHQLWNQEYPYSLSHPTISDLEAYLNGLTQQQHYLLTNSSNEVQGWAFTFSRDQQSWFAIILHHTIHRQGYGQLLLNEIKENISELNGWVVDQHNMLKENGESYISPLGFYLKNDFVIVPDHRLESAQINAAHICWRK